jgi:hypothetical protein
MNRGLRCAPVADIDSVVLETVATVADVEHDRYAAGVGDGADDRRAQTRRTAGDDHRADPVAGDCVCYSPTSTNMGHHAISEGLS